MSIMPARITGGGWWWAFAPSALPAAGTFLSQSRSSEPRLKTLTLRDVAPEQRLREHSVL